MENNLTNTNETAISTIDGLAAQARALKMSININMWQLARVFVEAKRIVPHGQWGEWLQENAEVSERTAQNMMAAYKRFGGIPQIEGIGQAKTFTLLPLPEGTVEAFLESNDVANMTTREVQDAVKKVREEANAEIQKERNARLDAERRAEVAEKNKNQPSAELRSELRASRERIAQQQEQVDRLTKFQESASGVQERLRQEIRERDELLGEQQAEIERAQRELLDLQSAAARGDAERIPADQLTLDAFSMAVRGFIGTCARMPQMRSTFAAMEPDVLEEYRVLLGTVERWVQGSRKAMEHIVYDAGGAAL